MPPTRDQVLNDPGFWQKSSDFQAAVLGAVDPGFSKLNTEQQSQALLALNAQRGSISQVNIDPNMSPADQAAARKMMADLNVSPGQAAAANAALNPTQPPAKRGVMETITGVPGAIGRGVARAIPDAFHFVADTVSKIPDLGTPNPVPADQPIPSRGAQVVESLKDVARGPAALLASMGDPSASPTPLGLISRAAQWAFPPPAPGAPPSPGREARQRLGELVALPPVFKGGAAALRAAGLGPAAARMATAATLGGVQAAPTGDPLQIIESATSMGTLGGLGEVAGAGGRLVGKGIGKAKELGAASGALKGDALIEQSKALGGGQGVMQEIIGQGARPRFGKIPEVLTTLEESGQTLQNAGRLAGEKVRAQSSALRQEAIKLAPKDATVPNSFVTKMQSLFDDGSTVLQSATERKLQRLAAELDTSGAGPEISIGGKSLRGAPPELLERLKAVLPQKNEGITFEKLTNLREDLNRLPAFDDFSKRLVGLAVKAVDSDIAAFGKKFPEPVRAYEQWKEFYTREVGALHGEGSPLRTLTETQYGRPTMPYSDKIPALVAMAPENIRSTLAGVRKGPNGAAAVDDIQAGAAQHLRELAIDQATGTTNPQALLKEFGNPKDLRRWREALGPRFEPYRKLAQELRSAGLTTESGAAPGAVHFWPTFHAMRGAMMAVGGNPVGAMYHLSTAGSMTLFPAVFEKIASNRAGAKLLAAGILEKPGTPRAGVIQEQIIRRAEQEAKRDPRLLMPPPAGPGSQVSGGAPGDRPFWRPPVVNMGEMAAPEGFRIPNAPPALRQESRTPTVQGPILQPTRQRYDPNTIRQGPPEVRQLPSSIDEAQAAVFYAREIARKGGPIEPALIDSLHGIAQNQAVPSELRNLAQRLVKVNFDRFPESQTAPIALKEIPTPPGLPLVQGTAGGGTANVDVGATTGRTASVKQLQMEDYVKSLKNVGPKNIWDNPSEAKPSSLMNAMTKGGERFLVPRAAMQEMQNTFGKEVARRWFSTEKGMPIDDAIGQFEQVYSIEGTFNAFKAFLEAERRK